MKFIRQDSNRFSKIGKNRKKLQKWRRPKGRDSKMRLKRKGYPASPLIGRKSNKKESGKIKGLTPIVVYNQTDLESISKDQIAILARIGAKKKIELLKYADENKILILNQGGNSKWD